MSSLEKLKRAALLTAICLSLGVSGAAAKETVPDATIKAGTPATGQRLVKSGNAKMECPGGTDKYCDGNKCGCWTQNE